MNNEVTIQAASTDILFFVSSIQNIDKEYYLTNNEFKILLKLIHYHNTNLKGKKNEYITWRNDQIAEHIFSPVASIKKTIITLNHKNYINVSTQTIRENGSFKKRRSISINWDKFEEILTIINKLKKEVIISPTINDNNKVEIEPIQQEIVQPESNNTQKNQEEMRRVQNPQTENQVWINELCDLEGIGVEGDINQEEKLDTIEEQLEVETEVQDDRTLNEIFEDLFNKKSIGWLKRNNIQSKIDDGSISSKEELIEEYNKYVK